MNFEDSLTEEQRKLNLKNKYAAEKYFGILDENGKVVKKGYVLHHLDSSLRTENVDRYIQWNINDLILISKSEHSKLHYNDRLINAWKGRHHSDESKLKIGKSNSIALKGHIPTNKGKKCYTNGVNNIYLSDDEVVPLGYYLGQLESCRVTMTEEVRNKLSISHSKPHNHITNNGRKWFTNGVDSKMLFEDEVPEGWYKGRKIK